jgi:hypothetical protein
MAMSPDRDEPLSRLYRQGASAEPPVALDALILAAARREAAAPLATAHRTPWWRNWLAPVGVFATLVLTVSLTLMVEREQGDALPAMAPTPAPAPVIAPVMPGAATASAPATAQPDAKLAAPKEMSKAKTLSEAPPLKAPATEPATPALASGPAPAPPAPAPPAPSSAAENQHDEMRAAAPAPLARPAVSLGAGSGALSAKATATSAVSSAPPAAAVPSPSVAAKRERAIPEPMLRSPEDWLEEIRRLKREGHAALAQEQLAAFRRAYPEFRLPDDLKPE